MKLLIAVCLLMTLSVSSHISAKESLFAKDDALFLVSSCQEVMEVFKRRDETSFMAGQRTSLSEAMRAGYCIGVLQQYSEVSPYCRYGRNNWYQMAQVIAEIQLTPEQLQNTSAKSILREAYCGE